MANVYVKLSNKSDMVFLAIEDPATHKIWEYSFAENMTSNFTESSQNGNFFKNAHQYMLEKMNTRAMIDFIRGFMDGNITKDQMNKGTAVGKKDNSSYARAARVLKVGMPDNVSVDANVVMFWIKSDLVNYIQKIQKSVNNLVDLPV